MCLEGESGRFEEPPLDGAQGVDPRLQGQFRNWAGGHTTLPESELQQWRREHLRMSRDPKHLRERRGHQTVRKVHQTPLRRHQTFREREKQSQISNGNIQGRRALIISCPFLRLG
ncbi:hypothetical protein C0J52_17587 [Blattella germanica]|nr:hypothetical protein C0J52_17587 [Blattella germanica]